jgi:beta-lactamase class A
MSRAMRHLAPVLVLALIGCTAQEPTTAVRPVGVVTARSVAPLALPMKAGHAVLPEKRNPTPEVVRYLKDRPGRAAVYVKDLKTGATFGYHEHARFITASVMKVNILTGLLLQKKHFSWSTAQQMIRYSDNTAADELYRLAGQGAGIGRVDRTLGLEHTLPFPTVWGATQTDPYDQVKLLGVLTDDDSPLSAAGRRKVLDLMETVTPSQRWGVKAVARPGDRVANKNGWTPMRFQGSGWAVHSIGRVTGHGHDYLIAVFSAEQPTMEAGIKTIEGLARIAVRGG